MRYFPLLHTQGPLRQIMSQSSGIYTKSRCTFAFLSYTTVLTSMELTQRQVLTPLRDHLVIRILKRKGV